MVLAIIVNGAVWGLAPVLAGPVFGAGFESVGSVMGIVILALIPMLLGYPAGMLAVIWKRPDIRLWAGGAALIVTGLGMSTIQVWGAKGAALAVVLGISTYTFVIWLFVREKINLAWGKGLLAIGLGGIYLPLLRLSNQLRF